MHRTYRKRWAPTENPKEDSYKCTLGQWGGNSVAGRSPPCWRDRQFHEPVGSQFSTKPGSMLPHKLPAARRRLWGCTKGYQHACQDQKHVSLVKKRNAEKKNRDACAPRNQRLRREELGTWRKSSILSTQPLVFKINQSYTGTRGCKVCSGFQLAENTCCLLWMHGEKLPCHTTRTGVQHAPRRSAGWPSTCRLI